MICPDILGAGGAMITATIIHHLQESFQNDSSVGIAYVYFSYQAKIDRPVSNIIGSLGWQLVEKLQIVPVGIMKLYVKEKATKSRPSLDGLLEILQVVMRASSRNFIVMDALDEYHALSQGEKDRERLNFLLAKFFELQKEEAFNLLATSRPITSIILQFEDCILKHIAASEDDIRSYVDTRMLHFRGVKISKHPKLQILMRSEVPKAASGM